MSRTLSSLPPETLTAILIHLPLIDKVRLRAVSPLWNSLLSGLLAKQKSLKIFSSLEVVEEYARELAYLNLQDETVLKLCPRGTDDELVIEPKYLTASTFKELLKLFPILDSLLIYFTKDTLCPFVELLGTFPNLDTLTLAGYIQPKDVTGTLDRFRKLPANLATLSSINLLFKKRKETNPDPIFSVPFYNRLQVYDLDEIVSPIFKQIGKYPKLRELSVNWTSNMSLEKLRSLVQSKQFGAKLSKLRLSAIESNYVSGLAELFPDLKFLDLEFANWPMLSQLTTDLARLSALQELRLAFIQIDKTWDSTATGLPQVRTLSLTEPDRFTGSILGFCEYPSNFSGNDLVRKLVQVFPNLEQLTIRCNTNNEDVLRRIEESAQFYFGSKLKKLTLRRKVEWQKVMGTWRRGEGDSVLGFLDR